MTRRERKKIKKAGNSGSAKEKHSLEVFSREEVDFISEAIHLNIHECKGAWEGTYIYDTKHLEDKQDSEQEFSLAAVTEGVQEDVGCFSVKSPAMMTPRQRRVLKRFATPIGHQSLKGSSRKFSPHTTSSADPYEGVEPQIFFRLGVEINHPTRNPKARKDLVAKLVAAVREDLEIIKREEAESAMREAGFWRWAGRTAYNTMKQTREEFDWATGQKKGTPRKESHPEDDDIAATEDLTMLDNTVEPHPETFRPLSQCREAILGEQNAVSAPTQVIDTQVNCKTQLEVVAEKENVEINVPQELIDDDENDGWSVVKRSRSKVPAKPVKKETIKSVYRKAGENLTISIR